MGEWIFIVIAYHNVGLCCQIGFPDIYIGTCIEWNRIPGSCKHLKLCFKSVLVVAHELPGTSQDIL